MTTSEVGRVVAGADATNVGQQVEDLKTRGNAAFGSGKYEESVRCFSEALSLDPTNHLLYSNRSASYASLRQYEEALADADKAVALKADWAKGHGRRGAALLGLGRLEEAKTAYEEGVRLEPGNAQLQRGLEMVQRELATTSSRVENPFADPQLLNKLQADAQMAEHLKDPQFRSILAELQRDPQSLTKYIKDHRVMQAFMTMLGVDSTKMSAAAGASASPHGPSTKEQEPALPRERQKDKVETATATATATETETRSETSDNAKAALREKELGNEAYKRRDFETALRHYDAAIGLDPNNISLLTNKSAVYFEQERYDECIAVCEEAVERGRACYADFKLLAKAFGRIGSCYERKGDYAQALQYYQKSLTEHRTPDILAKHKAAEKALDAAQRAAYHDPQLAEAERAAGNELFKAGNYVDALKHYTESIRRDESDARGYGNRAACYLKLAAVPEGIKDCDKAIALDPAFVKAYIRKAALLHLRRDYSEALAVLDLAASHDVDRRHAAEIQSLCAKCYEEIRRGNAAETGQGGGAGESEGEVLRRAMQNPEVREIMQDPVMAQILKQMQADPRAAAEHLKNPLVASKIRKLIAAGVIRTH